MDNLVIDLNYEDAELIYALYGEQDSNLKLIGDFYNIHLSAEGGIIYCDDETRVEDLQRVFGCLKDVYQKNNILEQQDVMGVLNNNYFKRFVTNGTGGRKFYLRTVGQSKLYDAYEKSVVTFAVGPAGTGKTFLAVVYAYNLLKKGAIKKIIITRPVVESGESLGFLPGDLKEKIDPYLRPIYDSFDALIGPENTAKYLEKGILEIAPLAYMRGRTLNDACVILDEAQNTTDTQIKMFLTRLGFNSKMIITGDITQIDLPSHKKSGLMEAIKVVKDIEEISVIHMRNNDVVRHPVVQKIIDAYDKK